ncbi:polymeric immunoglobulin receptor-like [Rhinichthys klamathensis goyatoka]|uniref:polymeric immunoglobulin receptor-like n=1 Tax=Rhinichthys klamathensis goyatoka TaxID=3034132 RepID=UPI0024B4DCE4|nr:polymeric immunoglobulin receptor-like [Rhinichthys klamathensis goyatoka]
MVNIGETATFSCEYSQNHINDPKIIFKEGEDSIETIYSTWNKTERFSVSDDKLKNLFNVRISAVTPDDGGVYLCGVWIYSHSYSYSIINTVHLYVGMAPVVRREGESAEIFCPYDSIYKSKPKSLCKGKCSTRDRNTLNETVREEKDTKTDRLTLNDDVTASVFTGTITGLTAEDAGKYWCAVTLERDVNYLYTHLIVIMNEELNLTKYEGDDMSIQCKHHDELQKCFCKAHEPSVCVKDGVSLEKIRDDRFSFSDEASTGVFTVNITDLREEDSGIYWCGSHIITKVNLTVKQGTDTHQLCVHYLGVQHARAALEGTACSECDKLPFRVLRSRLAVFDEQGQAREPRGSGPAVAEAASRRRSWGSQMDLSGGHGTATASSRSSSEDSDVLPPRVETREAEDPMLQLSGSEESDNSSIEAGDVELDQPLHAPAQEELVEVLTRAVAKLRIDWPQEELLRLVWCVWRDIYG